MLVSSWALVEVRVEISDSTQVTSSAYFFARIHVDNIDHFLGGNFAGLVGRGKSVALRGMLGLMMGYGF